MVGLLADKPIANCGALSPAAYSIAATAAAPCGFSIIYATRSSAVLGIINAESPESPNTLDQSMQSATNRSESELNYFQTLLKEV